MVVMPNATVNEASMLNSAFSRVRLTAIGVTALVDGLWLELCLSPGSFSADEARALAAAYL
ncbi:TetR family transcriptional regulator C-terminal domain-containing protein, partial [Paraburkholderia fungorum]|uniref:TetR family transcriptional regulator C-terminal domain-containing protein n=1 Tax=Paraburkholderia fungorum TaxID=134537 RepID=UPI000DB0CC53